MMAFLTATILLAIALLSIYIYQTSDHELTKMLAGPSAVVCLIGVFATAHWGLHLLCLLLLMRYKFPFQLKPIVIER